MGYPDGQWVGNRLDARILDDVKENGGWKDVSRRETKRVHGVVRRWRLTDKAETSNSLNESSYELTLCMMTILSLSSS